MRLVASETSTGRYNLTITRKMPHFPESHQDLGGQKEICIHISRSESPAIREKPFHHQERRITAVLHLGFLSTREAFFYSATPKTWVSFVSAIFFGYFCKR